MRQQTGRKKKKKTPWALILTVLLSIPAVYVVVQIHSATRVIYEYESVIQYQMTDSMEAEGILLYPEIPVEGSGNLGYLVKDGERVSNGTPLAEIYTSNEQASASAQLSGIDAQIDLLEKSQNTSSTQIDVVMAQRGTAIYNLLDAIDKSNWGAVDALQKDYLLAQNKLQIITGESDNFNPLIQQLKAQKEQTRAQLTGLDTIPAGNVGYFVSAENTQMLQKDSSELLAMQPSQLKQAMEDGVEKEMHGLIGKIVPGYTWQFVGLCSLEDSERFNDLKKVQISFPGKMETPLTANIVSVERDQDAGLAKFVLQCDYVNADVLRLGKETARIDFGTYTGLRVNAEAIRYVRETPEPGKEGETAAGENYVPGVYVKYGNLARFRRIQEIYRDAAGKYILVPLDGGMGRESQVRLYDEVIVSGQDLYDGKLL